MHRKLSVFPTCVATASLSSLTCAMSLAENLSWLRGVAAGRSRPSRLVVATVEDHVQERMSGQEHWHLFENSNKELMIHGR